MFLSLAWAPWVVGILTVLFLIVCVMMILTVLIQRPQGGGLSGAFGSGAGSGQTAFGAKTGDALTWFTIIVFVLFVAFAVVLNFAHTPPKSVPGATVQPASTESTGAAPAGTEAPSEAAPTTPPSGEPGTEPKSEPPAEPKSEPAPAPVPAPVNPPAEPAPQPK